MYKLNIKRLNDDLSDMSKFYEDKPNLSGDAGLDLHFPTQTLVQEKETVLIPLGISAEMVQYDIAKENLVLPSYQNLIPKSFFIVPRSSIYKTPLRMANSIGVIDSGYRGELMVPVDNPTDDEYMITPGERLFQIILPNLEEFEVEIVDELSETERGDGGFGSTGK